MHPLGIFTVASENANITIGCVFWWYKSATLQTGELIHRNHAKLNYLLIIDKLLNSCSGN